ncbi:hypothetical protein AXG93_4118s1010 [Marchantia polymorpha subsp. ruderalis]|uniref:Uncharacterized protein n=1 Tax=Marchantia polymorpha subsp. ruderalis TaxID=1480154 RepID=A0A176W2I5_MARPO|nr:hypothetical protein AXG93_4118s1010 [Marchantia polymorpha subsp. ruderalis]
MLDPRAESRIRDCRQEKEGKPSKKEMALSLCRGACLVGKVGVAESADSKLWRRYGAGDRLMTSAALRTTLLRSVLARSCQRSAEGVPYCSSSKPIPKREKSESLSERKIEERKSGYEPARQIDSPGLGLDCGSSIMSSLGALMASRA